MSMQQVNLYFPEFRPKKEWLTANTISGSALGFVVLLTVTVILLNRQLEVFEQEIVFFESQNNASETRVKRFKAMPRPANTRQIEQQLKKLKLSIKAREQIGQIIQGQNLGNEDGFSSAMRGLARQSTNTIALRRIRISRGGQFVELDGITKTAKDVPQYLQKLQAEASFQDVKFGLLSVMKHESSNTVHHFSLGFESIYQLVADKEGS